jgi:hypothetical protein
MWAREVFLPAPNPPPQQNHPHRPSQGQPVMAKAKLHQIKLTTGDNATQPPFPGGWVLAVFDALNSYTPAFAAKHQLPISQRTQERIKARAANPVTQGNYDDIEAKLVELVTALFPKTSAVNGFAKKYVNEYFRLWKSAAEFAPIWVKSLGFKPGESVVLGRALIRDLVLRLCYLESCERKLNQQDFRESELAFLRHDTAAQVYQALISAAALHWKMSVENLAGRLQVTDKSLHRIKGGKSLPGYNLLNRLKQPYAGHRLLVGIGFVDQLLKTLGLHKSVLRHEFLAAASVFFRFHPPTLDTFKGSIFHQTDWGEIQNETRDFEGYITFGDHLLLHPGFDKLWAEMPDALWRCHLHTLQFARNVDLAQAYYQFATAGSDAPLEDVLRAAEQESDDCPYCWMDKLRRSSSDLPLPPPNIP